MTVFIEKGDDYLTSRQATARGLAHYNQEKPLYLREAGNLVGDQGYAEWANQWLNDNVINGANNLFNYQLFKYREAIKRLDQIELSVGRAAYSEQVDTGETTTDEITFEVLPVMLTVDHPAIEPIPATIESFDIDEAAVTIANPIVTKDEVERTAAQAIIDNTSQEVKDFQ